MRFTLFTFLLVVLFAGEAGAVEICGNAVDDDANLLVDEGCYPGLVTQCENPLSCEDTGYVAPKSGALHHSLPADIAPSSPYGVPLAFRRFYMSKFEPGSGTPAYREALGERWGHSYATWLDSYTAPNPDQVVVHLPRGQDVMFQYVTTASGWDEFKSIQPGYHFQWLKRRTSSPNEYQLKTLTGEIMVYNSSGRLIEIWDALQTPNKTLLTYSGGHVSTVTDATTKRRLLFAYSGGRMSTVRFQINTGSWVTQHTTSYTYTNQNLTGVTIGGQAAQTNVYTSDYLTSIQDGNGNTLVGFVYDGAVAGKVVRVDTPRGVVGWEFASARASCSGQTVLYFHRANTTSCNTDADCGTGNLCGGKTGAGTTGQCFRGARCLTVASPSEDVITTVSSFAGNGEPCDGACLDAIEHVWDTTGGRLDLLAEKTPADPSNYFEVKEFDANGLPTKIMYGATTASGTGAQRTMFLSYNTTFPGLVATTRRQSSLDPSTCTSTGGGACATTTNTYTSDGKLDTVTETGKTYDTNYVPSGSAGVSYSYTTNYDYDTKGRLFQIDGPLSGSTDLTLFEYWTSSDPTKDGFLQNFKRQKDASNLLTQSSLAFDFWGNATSISDADGTISCQTFDAARGYLTQRRETMAGQTDCTANSADLVTGYLRDTALRLTRLTRPDGSCLIYEYDTRGRLARTKRRDDCNAATAGDRQEYTYSDDGLLIKVETFDASNAVTKRQEMTYRDSRRIEKLINPVNTAKWTGISYTPRGLVDTIAAVDGANELSKTAWTYNADGRVVTENRYSFNPGDAFDTWNVLFDWIGNQKSVTDDDAKTTGSTRDDLGRLVLLSSPDLGGFPTLRVHDAAGRVTILKESVNGASQKVHTFTFDHLGRPLVRDAGASCLVFGFPVFAPDVTRVYDSLAGAPACPTSGCTNLGGRLAYVKVRLMCMTGGHLEQQTWYGYDAAGRQTYEYISDTTGRIAIQSYAWTKNGALAQTTLPSGAVHGATFGSAGSNSDTDRIAALWRTTTATPIINNILYQPYGPFRQYNQLNSIGGSALRTKVSHNLAYRVTETRVETQASAVQHAVAITEDNKGRVIGRDYTPNAGGVVDSYFVYDGQDRVLCERPTAGTSCPTSFGGEKNNHYSSSGARNFTAAGDWVSLWRPIQGSTGWGHTFSLVGATHQIYEVSQSTGSPVFGTTRYTYDSRGNRGSDDNITSFSNDQRTFAYDTRRNVAAVQGKYFVYQGPTCGNHGQPPCWGIYDYTMTSAFDALNRRVFKSVYAAGSNTTATWFFYYDALNRLSEIRYTPNTGSPSTYSLFELRWLGDQLVAYWQTDYPSVTTSKRYVGRDESGRPIDMMSWPATGDATRVWAINPDAWGNDTLLVGAAFQPIVFAGQYQDAETIAYGGIASPTRLRPGLVLNGFRTYDPWTGSYLQVDPLVDSTWSSYLYVDSDPVGKQDPDGLAINITVTVSVGNNFWTTGEVGCWSFNNTEETSSCLDQFSDPFGDWGGVGWGGLGWGGGGGQTTDTGGPFCASKKAVDSDETGKIGCSRLRCTLMDAPGGTCIDNFVVVNSKATKGPKAGSVYAFKAPYDAYRQAMYNACQKVITMEGCQVADCDGIDKAGCGPTPGAPPSDGPYRSYR